MNKSVVPILLKSYSDSISNAHNACRKIAYLNKQTYLRTVPLEIDNACVDFSFSQDLRLH